MTTIKNNYLEDLLEPCGSEDTDNLSKPVAFTWRDYTLMLLKIDASIEHGLMVQYLYAAYSLGGSQVPEDKRPMVRNWQQTILSIAKEEMGHLLTVQNIITLLGGAVSFEREDYPWDSDFYPFPFELQPLTLDSLARYVYTEAPLDWEPSDEKTEINDRLNNSKAPPKEENSGINGVKGVKKIAALFRTILAIMGDPERLPDDEFDPSRFTYQAKWARWGRNQGAATGVDHIEIHPDAEGPEPTCPIDADLIIIPVATRDEAIEALRKVAEQGEDPPSGGGDEQSHFLRFKQIYQQYKKHFPEDGGISPSRDLPINPTTFANTRSLGDDVKINATPITNEESAKWATLFDLRYRLLLTNLSYAYRLVRLINPNKGPGTYQKIMHQSFCEMYNLKAISDILVRRPLEEGADINKQFKPAGPSFHMPYTLELPESATMCWMQFRDILGGCNEIRLWLEARHTAETRFQEVNYLAAMGNADRDYLEWLNTVLEATKVAGSMDQ